MVTAAYEGKVSGGSREEFMQSHSTDTIKINRYKTNYAN